MVLWQAAQAGTETLVGDLLQNSPEVDVNWVGPEMGDSAFHRACRFGHLGVVKLLLGWQETNLNLGNAGGGTAFNVACQEGHTRVVSLLLGDPRVDIAKMATRGCTPLYVACDLGETEVAAMLLDYPDIIHLNQGQLDNSTPLWIASQNGHLPIVRLLLASHVDVDTAVKSKFNSKTAAQHARNQPRVVKSPRESDESVILRQTNGPLIADLIDAYEANSVAVREQARRTPGTRGLLAL